MSIKQKQSYHTAIDNDGVQQTLTFRQWAEHPDTFAYDAKGERRGVTQDMVRHKSYQQTARGYSDRQVVHLDPVKHIKAKGKVKKNLNEELRTALMTKFHGKRLVPCLS